MKRDTAFILLAYFGHLLVPAALLVDVFAAWSRGEITLERGDIETTIAGLAAMWLVAGLVVPVLSRDRERFARSIRGPLFSVYALYMVLVLFEALGRAVLPLQDAIPGLTDPGTRRVFSVDPSTYPGVQGTKRFTINEWGLRGAMPPGPKGTFNIIAVGGSTTICAILDDSEAWPNLLMRELNADDRVKTTSQVWIGNAGVNGANTVHHLALLQWLPGVLPADMLIFLVGVNDMNASLAFEGAPTEASLEKSAGLRQELRPGTRWRSLYPLYRRTLIFKLIRTAARNVGRRFNRWGVERPFDIVAFRARRAKAPTVPLPDLHLALNEYRGRLIALARRCEALEVRCLFLTQPSMWRPGLSPSEQSLLWLGYVGPWEHTRGYASAADMAYAMAAYNRTLLEVCREKNLECYDLASDLPRDTSAFNDDVHFNEAGSRMVAKILTQYLLSHPPFAAQGQSTRGRP